MEARNRTYTPISFVAALFMVLPSAASAQVVISEVMYDLDGADSGREWVEVFNAGGSSVLLTDWRLFEADTNHKISAVSGGDSLASGTYAVVADNAAKFMEDNPGYSGQLFDSAFSLSNAGETLTLRDADLVDRDSVAYSPDWGAAGDGNSLQRASGGGSFAAAAPTPGSGSLSADASAGTNSAVASTAQGSGSTVVTPAASSASTPSGTLRVAALDDMTVVVGADTQLVGAATHGGTALTSASFVWNFGDGAIFVGREAVHRWMHVGKFVVTLEVSVDGASAHDSFIVTVKPLALTITVSDLGNIILSNTGTSPIDLSGWKLAMGSREFVIPKYTQLLAGSSIVFDIAVTRLNHLEHPARVYYPSGALAVEEDVSKVDTPAEQEEAATIGSRDVSRTVTYESPVIGRMVAPTTEASEPIRTMMDVGRPSSEGGVEMPSRTSVGQMAAAASATPVGWTWYLSLIGLTGLGAFAAVAARRSSRQEWQIEDMDEKS